MKKQTVKRQCPSCHRHTIITITESGKWETWDCQECGGRKAYKVG